MNQIARKKYHFLDENEISHFVENLSPEMEKIIDGQKRMEMNKKITTKCKDCSHTQNSYNVLTKKKETYPKNKGLNLKNNRDLMKISQKSLSSQSKKILRPTKGLNLSRLEENDK